MSPRPDLVLVTGPMVGASSWGPTADRLRTLGWRVHVPDILASSAQLAPWRQLSTHYARLVSHYARLVSLEDPPILVGHSLATVVIADMAGRIPACGLIMLDGEIPPASGPVPPGSDSFRAFIAGLADRDGYLPPWSDWYDQRRSSLVGIEQLAQYPDLLATLRKDQPRVTRRWFDDRIDLAPWSHIPSGFIQTSVFFDHAADEAQRRGWPALRIKGTHLHPTLQPDETAAAIEAICAQFARN